MQSNRPVQYLTWSIVATLAAGSSVLAQNAPNQRNANPTGAQLTAQVEILKTGDEGYATFITGKDRQAIPVATAGGRSAIQPEDFLAQYGPLFGVSDVATELVETRALNDDLGQTHTDFEQVYNGVSVFSGILKVHQNARGEVVAANGAFHPIGDKLNTVPALSVDEVIATIATDWNAGTMNVERADLVIVDPGWYGDPARGAHLAYYVIVSDTDFSKREASFIDAHTGETLDAWSLEVSVRNRAVYNGNGGSTLPGTLIRAEGDEPVASPDDANYAYDFAGDIYDYYDRAHGRDSIDGNGMTMVLTVNSNYPPCPNAQWTGSLMVFCSGTVTDDITAHELTHGVTQHTANLIYQNQSGQMNEAYSDIFGELIDLYNGDVSEIGPPAGSPNWPAHPTGSGQDTPNNARSACSSAPGYPDGVRWLMGEDATAFGGAIRDMWNPVCEGDPDRNNSPLQTCNPLDNGGVHSGSGVLNHTFAIITDGKTFNGQTVTGIGAIKSGAVFYRALATYLTPSSDYADAYAAINTAANDLIGTFPNNPITGAPSASMFTAADAAEVNKAMLATEMDTDGSCGATANVLSSIPPTLCDPRSAIFADDFEGGVNGWTTAITGSPDTPYNWVQATGLPIGRTGSAWYCEDLADGCPSGGEESAVHQLISPVINIPTIVGSPTLKFTHFMAVEAGYDGGNVRVKVNGGAWTLVEASDFTYNTYNGTLNGGDNTNPLASQPAWHGAGGGWGTSVIDLSGIVSGGDTLQVRFDFGKDYCNGIDGWYIDDFEVFDCTCAGDEDCDDGVYCNGEETCVSGFCSAGSDPCVGEYCNDTIDACVPALFVEDFENGNVQGWSLRGSGSTASTGDWVFGNPNGTSNDGQQAQPEDAYEGVDCAFTGQNSSLGTDDVDGGVIYLVSPAIDLSGQASAQLVFERWYYNRDLGVDSGDYYVAQVSANNGSSWVTLETIPSSQRANSWTQRAFDLENFVSLTSTVRIRFGASDGTSSGNIIEAAIDDLRITGVPQCSGDGECDDNNVCNGIEHCNNGACEPGTPLICDDTNTCTDDTCDSVTGCVFTANDGNCPDDGLFCNGTPYCDVTDGCLTTGDPCTANDDWCSESASACILYGDGDMDSDGDHDLYDYMRFQECFGSVAGPACYPGNLTGDGLIDLADFDMLVTSLSAGGPN
ncbi:MAG: M4 family metallopeptidase [Phycisphaerales bacterium]|nr:M4 family metallopeptidase [Phycisphaerales bacterium]